MNAIKDLDFWYAEIDNYINTHSGLDAQAVNDFLDAAAQGGLASLLIDCYERGDTPEQVGSEKNRVNLSTFMANFVP